ncbi:MAG: hypothetical protein ACRDFW_08790 [bacterium]
MYPDVVDRRLQVSAAIALLETSRLVEWNATAGRFQPVDRELFEVAWRLDVHPVFGRLMCWMLFAAGSEFLLKGVCLLNGIEIRHPQEVPVHPSGGIAQWVPAFLNDWKSTGTTPVTHFGALGALTYHDYQQSIPAPLKRLCSAVGAAQAEDDLLFATYELLRRTIRNRDAHAYVPNVRDTHHSAVPALFCDCFNVLVQWLPGGPPTVNEWKQTAESFIGSL